MRKAVAQVAIGRRGGRRKEQQQQQQQKASPEKAKGPPKMTPDEAALTAKNYRLAKELVSEDLPLLHSFFIAWSLLDLQLTLLSE